MSIGHPNSNKSHGAKHSSDLCKRTLSIKKKRILIVDDDPNIRSLLCVPLRDRGYEVIEMENGLHATRWFIENRADLIVLDVVMPEMDGIEFAYAMKRRFPKMPILAISAGEHVMSKELCLKFMKSLGAVEAIAKPFDLNFFMATVRRVLSPKKEA